MLIDETNYIFQREIPLTQGKVAIVDAADYDWLMQWKWCADFNTLSRIWYARRGVSIGNGDTTPELMHRVIVGATGSIEVDHINNDGLCNRRFNLRLATHQQNSFNRGKTKTTQADTRE